MTPAIANPKLEVELQPFPPKATEKAWAWLNEFPKYNFDDDGPTSLNEFKMSLLWRVQHGQTIIGVIHESECVGLIGIERKTERRAEFCGICFSKAVHGKGVAAEALRILFRTLWADGVDKVEAQFFADNYRVARFFHKLGAKSEGVRRAHTLRGGKAVDCRLVGWTKEDWKES